VSEHLVDLCRDGCESNRECLIVAKLLSEYKDVLSCSDHDMGLTKAVCHEIPLAAETGPIRQPTRPVSPEKKKEVSHQVQNLLN